MEFDRDKVILGAEEQLTVLLELAPPSSTVPVP